MPENKKYTEDPLMTEDPQFLRSEEPADEGLDYGDDPRGKIIPDSGELNISQLDAWLEEQNDEEDYITRGDLSYLEAMSIDPKGEEFTIDPDTEKIVRREEAARTQQEIVREALGPDADPRLNLYPSRGHRDPNKFAAPVAAKPKPFPKMGLAREMAVVKRLKRKYGGISTQKIAIALGAAEMLDPIGFVDIGAAVFSDELREEILYLKEKHPKTVHGIEAIGFFTGTMLTKGFSKIAFKVLGPKFMKKLLDTKASKLFLGTGRVFTSEIRASNAVGEEFTKRFGKTKVGRPLRMMAKKRVAEKISPALAPAIKYVSRTAHRVPGEAFEGGLFGLGQAVKGEVLSETSTPEEDAELVVTSMGLSALVPTVFRLGWGGIKQTLHTMKFSVAWAKNWGKKSEIPLLEGKHVEEEIYQRSWTDNALLKILTDGTSPNVSGMDPAVANLLLRSLTRGDLLKKLNVWLKSQGMNAAGVVKGSSQEKTAGQLDYIITSYKKMKEDIKDGIDSYYSSPAGRAATAGGAAEDVAKGESRLYSAVSQAAEEVEIKGMTKQNQEELADVSSQLSTAKIDKGAIRKKAAASREEEKELIADMGVKLSRQKFIAKKADLDAEGEIALIETTRANIEKIALEEGIALEGDWTPGKMDALKEIMDGYNIDRKLLDEFFDVAGDGVPTNLRAGASTKRLAAYLNRLLGNSVKGLKGKAKQDMNERKLSIIEGEEGLAEMKLLFKGDESVSKKEIDEYIDYLVERKNYLNSRIPELKRAAEATLAPIPTALPRNRSSKLVKMNDVADEYNRGKIPMLTPAVKGIAEDLVRQISNIQKKLSKKNIPEAEKNRLEDHLYDLLDREGRGEDFSTWGLNKILDYKSSGGATKNLEKHIFQSQYLSGGTEASTLNDMRSMVKQMRDMGDNVSYKDAEDFKSRSYGLATKDRANYNEGYMMAAQMTKDHIIKRMEVSLGGMVDAGVMSASEAAAELKKFVDTNRFMSLLIPTAAASGKAAAAALEDAAGKGLEFKGIDAAGFLYNPKFPIIRMVASKAAEEIRMRNFFPRGTLAAAEYSAELRNFMYAVALESEMIIPDAKNAILRSSASAVTAVNRRANESYTGRAEKRIDLNIDAVKKHKATLKRYKEAYNAIKGKLLTPETTIGEISEELGPIFDMNPSMAGKSAQRVLADMQYINDNILTKETDYFTGEPSPSVDDVYNYANTMRLLEDTKVVDGKIVSNPPNAVIIEMVEQGTLDARTAKTYRDLRPNLYKASVNGIMQGIAEMRKKGLPIDYSVQLAITNLIPDLDFSNPSIGVLTEGIMKIVHTNDEKAQPTSSGKTDISSKWATGPQEIEKRQGQGKESW